MRRVITIPARSEPTTQSRARRVTVRPTTYTVEQAAAMLGISRSHAYECVRSGDIPSLRFRRRIVVPAKPLDAMLSQADD